MKKIISIIMAAVAAFAFATTPVYADTTTSEPDVCEEWKNKTGYDPNYEIICGKKSESDATARVGNILNTVFFWAAIVAVLVIIIGGVMYITAQGDKAKIVRAKSAILYAVIGLIVVLLSFAIVNFILTNVQGS